VCFPIAVTAFASVFVFVRNLNSPCFEEFDTCSSFGIMSHVSSSLLPFALPQLTFSCHFDVGLYNSNKSALTYSSHFFFVLVRRSFASFRLSVSASASLPPLPSTHTPSIRKIPTIYYKKFKMFDKVRLPSFV
jgi:hypothetical protein